LKPNFEHKQRADNVSNNLKLLQKEYRGYDNILFDMSSQARSNRKMIGKDFRFYSYKITDKKSPTMTMKGPKMTERDPDSSPEQPKNQS